MKLFSWMHRKSKTDITSSVNGSTIGLKSSFDNQGIYATPNNNNYSTLKWLPQNHYFEDFSAENYEELNTRENDEIFPGFLTIGTLSVEPVTEPSTPTFGFSSQDTDEEKKADIKYDLKHLSEDFDKSLEDESEATNNSTSNNGQASIITSSVEVKKEEATNAADQLYPRATEKKGAMSLHRLFKKGIMMKRSSISGDEKTDRKAAKEPKLSKTLTNKMLWIPPICSDVSVASAVKPLPKVIKPSKMKGMFHKKIHPEISKVATEDANGYSNYGSERVLNNSKSTITKSNKIGCWTSLTSRKKYRFKTDLKSPADTVTNTNLDLPKDEMADCASREHWINTDDEFFVLELQENKGKHVYN